MDRFGVTSPHLKSRARTWDQLGGPLKGAVDEPVDTALYHWQGATLRNLVNFGRESAILGSRELADNRGILIKAVAADSVAARAKLPADAAILAANDRPVASLTELTTVLREAGRGPLRLKVFTVSGYVEVMMPAGEQLPARSSK
jgi:S1-C subfamily serine protease